MNVTRNPDEHEHERSALKASPEDDLALVAMADISLRQGNKPAALKAIERAIAANPAQKGQLRRNKSFAALVDDAEFQRLIK